MRVEGHYRAEASRGSRSVGSHRPISLIHAYDELFAQVSRQTGQRASGEVLGRTSSGGRHSGGSAVARSTSLRIQCSEAQPAAVGRRDLDSTRPQPARAPRELILLVQPSQHLKQFFVLRRLSQRVDLGEGDYALLVDDENGALGDTRNRISLAQHSIFDGDFAMRPKIAGQRKSDPADILLLPGDVARNGIHAYAHDLGIVSGKLLYIEVCRRNLSASGRGPIEGVEGQDHVPSALEVAKPEPRLGLAHDGG